MAVMVKFENVESGEPEPAEFVLFAEVRISYVYLLVRFDHGKGVDECLATCSFSGGVWKIGLSARLLKQFGNQYDGTHWTDVSIRSV